jgi:hypothetical protein
VPSEDGSSCGTGLLPWFWAAQQLLVQELQRRYVAWEQPAAQAHSMPAYNYNVGIGIGSSSSEGSGTHGVRFKQLIRSRVLLAQLVITAFNLLKRGGLSSEQLQLSRLDWEVAAAEQQAAVAAAAGQQAVPAPTGTPDAAAAAVGVEAGAAGGEATGAAAAAGIAAERGAKITVGSSAGPQASHNAAAGAATAGLAAVAAAVLAAKGTAARRPAGRQTRRQQQQQGSYSPLDAEAVAAAERLLDAAARALTHTIPPPPPQQQQPQPQGQQGQQQQGHGQGQHVVTHVSSSGRVHQQVLLAEPAAALMLVKLFYPGLLSEPALQPGAEGFLPNIAVERDAPPRFLWSWGEWWEPLPQQQLCCLSGLKLGCFGIQPLRLRKHLQALADAAAAAGGTGGTAQGGGTGGSTGGSTAAQGLLPWFLSARELLLRELLAGVWGDVQDTGGHREQLRQHIMGRVQLLHVVLSVHKVLQQAAEQWWQQQQGAAVGGRQR